jgi:hypothetical protein
LSIYTSLRRIAMPYASKRNRSKEGDMEAAASNRRKIIAASLSGRDLMRMVLLTSAGLLITKGELSVHTINSAGEPADLLQSPPVPPFLEPSFIPPIAQPVASLTPAPTEAPDTATGEQ